MKVEYDRLELLEFLRGNFDPMNAMCERVEMFERLIHARTKALRQLALTDGGEM